MAEWKEYNGSDDQIAEMDQAESFIIKANGVESHVMHCISDYGMLVRCDAYLICNKHKYANIIQRWSVTGQPVWVRYDVHRADGEFICHQKYVTTTPDWNIPNAEYSFTPFED